MLSQCDSAGRPGRQLVIMQTNAFVASKQRTIKGNVVNHVRAMSFQRATNFRYPYQISLSERYRKLVRSRVNSVPINISTKREGEQRKTGN